MSSPVFHNEYSDLPDRFYVRQAPAAAPDPRLFALNEALATELGLEIDWLRGPEGLAMMSGNALPDGAAPLAQAYAGHQFGGWVPQLGDGRAILIGEIDTPSGGHVDLQLKGAGRTPFSRNGDGLAALGPVLREYLVSEAMAALGIPTTRALAAVLTGGTVLRERPLPGAVLTRVASSHVRVGTFQYFAARQDTEALRLLADFVRRRHYPQAETVEDLLAEVVAAQARLVAAWMSVGFIHGVMNTDNMAVSGETIDYGPCAFMDGYHSGRVFSSIDQYGRYAYGNQPNIAGWNLAQFASCLLPLMGEEKAAIARATEIVNGFGPAYSTAWLNRFGAKIGLAEPGAEPEDARLIQDLLATMEAQELDFTLTFRALTRLDPPPELGDWVTRWRARIARQGGDAAAVMGAANPVIIPRNHRVEQALAAALEGDRAPFDALHRALATPFVEDETTRPFMAPPSPDEVVTATFCGT